MASIYGTIRPIIMWFMAEYLNTTDTMLSVGLAYPCFIAKRDTLIPSVSLVSLVLQGVQYVTSSTASLGRNSRRQYG